MVTGQVAYGCCVGSWEKFGRNVVPYVEARGRPVLGLSGQTSITAAYNAILSAYRGTGLDALILLHDDLEITDPDAEAKILDAFAGDEQIALAGVAGGSPEPPTIAWWTGPSVGHQMTDSGPVDFGERSGDVLFIEGSLMALSPWAVDRLHFDERYPGFLGYDDICVTAKRRHGKRVVVLDIDTHHHSTLGFKSEAIRQSWNEADILFREKWGIA